MALTCHHNGMETLGATAVATTLGITETVRVVTTLQVTGATQHWHQEGALTSLLAVLCHGHKKMMCVDRKRLCDVWYVHFNTE